MAVYEDSRVVQDLWTRPLMGPNMIHDPTDQKTVSQYPDRFWTLTCDNDYVDSEHLLM